MAEVKEKPAENPNKLSFAAIIKNVWNEAGKYRLFGFALAFASLILFLFLALKVYQGESIAFDETLRQVIRQNASPSLAQALMYVSFLGSRRFLIGGVIVVLIVLIALKWKRAIILLLLAMAGQAVLEVTLKSFFQRPRPEPFFAYPPLESYSFPSGHALSSFCFYVISAWLAAKHLKNKRGKFTLWILTAALVLLIGSSRLYLGVHFPSDVLAGFALAFTWIFIVISGSNYLEKKTFQN